MLKQMFERHLNNFCVIGFSKFGLAITNELVRKGKNVMVLDINKDVFNKHLSIYDEIEYNCVDCTNEDALKTLGIQFYNTIFVAIGENIENSLTICSLLIDLGIKNIYCKAVNLRHKSMLKKIGVTHIVWPEQLAGRNTALRAINRLAIDFSSIAKNYSLFSCRVKNPSLDDKKLSQIDITHRFACNILLVRHHKKWILATHDTNIHINDVVYFIAVEQLAQKIITYVSKK